MIIYNNYVLIKPERYKDHVVTPNGTKIYLVPMWEKERHYPTTGVVMQVPESLYYDPDTDNFNGAAYDVDMELQPEDVVLFNYKAVAYSLEVQGQNPALVDGGVFIRYDSIYCAIRNGEIVPVNGYIIVEAETMDLDFTAPEWLELPEIMKKNKSKTRGKVLYTGSPVRGYRSRPELASDSIEINVGDTIMFLAHMGVKLQTDEHQTVGKGRTIYRLHRKDVVLNETTELPLLKEALKQHESIHWYFR